MGRGNIHYCDRGEGEVREEKSVYAFLFVGAYLKRLGFRHKTRVLYRFFQGFHIDVINSNTKTYI